MTFSFTFLFPLSVFFSFSTPIPIWIMDQFHFLLRTISQILPRLFYSLCQPSCLFWKIFVLLAVLLDTTACFPSLNAALIISFSGLESSLGLYILASYSILKKLSHLGDGKDEHFTFWQSWCDRDRKQSNKMCVPPLKPRIFTKKWQLR